MAGGRGVGSEEGFGPLRDLAAALGGAVGASRAAADAGWIPYQLQIGQTGKVVKPALYIGAGISGAIQHRVGMQTAEHVIAINRDPDAPIGEFADLFVVGDLFQIVPGADRRDQRRKGGREYGSDDARTLRRPAAERLRARARSSGAYRNELCGSAPQRIDGAAGHRSPTRSMPCAAATWTRTRRSAARRAGGRARRGGRRAAGDDGAARSSTACTWSTRPTSSARCAGS